MGIGSSFSDCLNDVYFCLKNILICLLFVFVRL